MGHLISQLVVGELIRKVNKIRPNRGPKTFRTELVDPVWKKFAVLGRQTDFWYAAAGSGGRVPIGRGYLTHGAQATTKTMAPQAMARCVRPYVPHQSLTHPQIPGLVLPTCRSCASYLRWFESRRVLQSRNKTRRVAYVEQCRQVWWRECTQVQEHPPDRPRRSPEWGTPVRKPRSGLKGERKGAARDGASDSKQHVPHAPAELGCPAVSGRRLTPATTRACPSMTGRDAQVEGLGETGSVEEAFR